MTDPRRMPSLPKVAKAHGLGETPSCYRCGLEIPETNWKRAGKWLDRAHVIDRCSGGPDDASNLRPLCHECHDSQPAFMPGDEAVALYWFTGGNYGQIIRHFVNRHGEQMVFVHNGRMGLVFHDDKIMPASPLVLLEPGIKPLAGCFIVDGSILSKEEGEWLRECFELVKRKHAPATAVGVTA